MEICFRESKEILLYGMKKYCVSEGLVNWPFENLQNLRQRTRANAKPTPTHITYTKPTPMHKTYANAQNLR